MIRYSDIESPFFQLNKSFTEELVSSLLPLKLEVNGWCNAYGYDLKVKNPIDGSYLLHIEKAQNSSKRNIFRKANTDHFRYSLTCTIVADIELSFGQSRLRTLGWEKHSTNQKNWYSKGGNSRQFSSMELWVELESVRFISKRENHLSILGNGSPNNWPTILNSVLEFK